MLQPGLVSITFRQLTPREIVDLVVEAELKGIEWGGDVHVPHGEVETAKEVRQMTEDAGLTIPAYGSYYRVAAPDVSPAFDAVLKSAVALNAPVIRVWAGNRGSVEADTSYWQQVVDDSRRIATMAAAEGIRIAYEYHRNTLTDTNESAQRLLADVQHENIYTFWQPHHHLSIEENNAGLEAVLSDLTNVHVFHWTNDGADRHPLKEGAEKWTTYLQTVRSTGREHFALIEFVKGDTPEMFREDARTLKEWLQSL